MLIVLTTTPTEEEAEQLASQMVEQKLAACVQVLPNIKSIYFWEGRIQKEGENLLLIKTLDDRYSDLEKFILEHHSYEIPEIVALNSEHVSGSYLKWLSEFVRS
ncbi:MAG: divalent-cation tolerance protein CutA [Pyrinomonadaceae bacterium]|jgi:periplasmic divalent cation tolerance protein|nr:divalent-cation tolerance protein CutA [Blastocatellia bacterium]MCW5956621.1 divalent-cation tolerance protein CutA [Pyrinomonadaceae bacterium]